VGPCHHLQERAGADHRCASESLRAVPLQLVSRYLWNAGPKWQSFGGWRRPRPHVRCVRSQRYSRCSHPTLLIIHVDFVCSVQSPHDTVHLSEGRRGRCHQGWQNSLASYFLAYSSSLTPPAGGWCLSRYGARGARCRGENRAEVSGSAWSCRTSLRLLSINALSLCSPAPFPHWTIKEIFEQPEAISRTLNYGSVLNPS
jgi:hypothetical protein